MDIIKLDLVLLKVFAEPNCEHEEFSPECKEAIVF